MRFGLFALLLFITVVFASFDLQFLAFVTIVIIAMLAVTDTAARPAGAAVGVAATGAAAAGGLLKKTVITKDGGAKVKVVDFVERDEVKWQPIGRPKNWGRTPYEEFGSGLAQTVMLPVRFAKGVWKFFSGGK